MAVPVNVWPLDLLLWDWDDDFYPLEENFGYVVYPQDIHQDRALRYKRQPSRFGNAKRRRRQARIRRGSSGKNSSKPSSSSSQSATDLPATIGKDGFQMCINVEEFQPNELTVKTLNNWIIVEGKHEEREDEEGFISRHFIRKYHLPEGYNPMEVISTLSSDGILTIKAPPPPSKESKANERLIEIRQTGPAHLSVKENPQEEKEKTEESCKVESCNG